MGALMLAGIFAIHVTGVIDDVKGTNPTTKLAGQLVAAAALANLPGASLLARDIWSAFGVDSPPHFAVQMLAATGSAALVLGATNAMNLIDGLDGLCASLSCVAQAGFATIALYILARHPQDDGAKLALLLAIATFGANLGYLKWNWFPARIFMGDAGSLMLGYLVAMQAILLAGSSPPPKAGRACAFCKVSGRWWFSACRSPTPPWPSCGASGRASPSWPPTPCTCTTCCGASFPSQPPYAFCVCLRPLAPRWAWPFPSVGLRTGVLASWPPVMRITAVTWGTVLQRALTKS